MERNQSLSPGMQNIIFRIVEAVQPMKVYLFGSRAKGIDRLDSDVDLLLIYNGPLSKRELKLRVYSLFDRSDFSFDVFVLSSDEMDSLKSVANTLAREVNETGILCYG